jgi:microsomal dipeptidase-like Zn-dependent dipeptidase
VISEVSVVPPCILRPPAVTGVREAGRTSIEEKNLQVKHGYSDQDIAKVAGQNVLRVLKETWAR